MRKSSPLLSPLFTPTMQGVLAATVLRPQREWYLSDLASHLGVGPSSLQRTLAKLTLAGILNRRENGNRVYYRPDPQCPILGELAGMLAKTAGIAEPLRDALSGLAKKIRVAFIHGSVAEERERAESDVDVIVVGDAPGLELSAALRPVQDRLGRAVNVTRYTPKEFAAKVADGQHFLSSVLQKKRIFLIGGEHELEEAAGRKARGRRTNQQERA
jgi:predicted nucleotidyltransferase/DNA-binding MarR family transcriptional regulator